MDLIAYAPQSKVLTSTGTAVSTLLPLDQNSGYPKEVRITATAPCYVELGDIGVTAVVGDALVQPRDHLVAATCGARSISVISVSGTASITVTALESGSVQSALTSPSLSLDMLSGVLSSAVTFTRASSGTYFDSTGRLATQGYNLLQRSSEFTNAAWSKTDVTPTLSDSSPLDVGYLMTEGTLLTASLAQIATVTAGSTITASFVLKRGNTDWVRINALEATGTDGGRCFFNLATGTKGTAAAFGAATNVSGTIAPLGGGWYRCTVTATPNGTYTNAQATVFSAAGDGGSRVSGATYYVSAAQLEVGTVANNYSPTTTAANGGARFDNDPATLRPLGLLIEEQRTNLLLHSRDMTQAAWSKTDVTPTRNQVGIDGTANSACLMTEGSAGTAVCSQAATVAAGSTITASSVLKRGNCDWVRIIAAETTNTDGAQAWFNLATGAVGTVAARGAGTSNSGTITNLGGGWYRCTVTTIPNGTYTTARTTVLSASANGSGALANATYIVDAAQLEVGSFATSIITTGAATVTRAADSASMTGANFSSWYNQTAGSFVAEFRRFGFDNVAGAVGICQADDGTSNNRVALRLGARVAACQAQQTIAVASVVNLNEGLGPVTSIDGLNVKAAIGYQVGVGATGRDGTIANATSNPSLPTVTQLNVGQGPSAAHLNGWLRRLTYYPVRLGNSQLQALTT